MQVISQDVLTSSPLINFTQSPNRPIADNYEDRYFNRGCHGLGAECLCSLHLPAAQRWVDQIPGVAVHSTELKLQLSCNWYDSIALIERLLY